MKKIFIIIVVLLIVCILLVVDLFVFLEGNDWNLGIKDFLKVIFIVVLCQVREFCCFNDESVKGGIIIYLEVGDYYLYEFVFICLEDSGMEVLFIVIILDGNVVLNGGVEIRNWKK